MSEYVDLQRSCACTSSDIVLTWEIQENLFLRVGIVCMSGMNDL